MNKVFHTAKRVYVDSCIIIYFVEGFSEFRPQTEAFFAYAEENDIELVSSELTLIECAYGAHKSGNPAIPAAYRELFEELDTFELVSVRREIIDETAKNGVAQNLRLADAVHFTTAIYSKCDVLLTNDHGIKSTDALKVVQLGDL